MRSMLYLTPLFLLLLAAAPVLALDPDQYTKALTTERTINVTGNSSNTVYFSGIVNDCAGNPCHYTYYESYYKIPEEHILTEPPLWQVKHGSLNTYNVSVPSAYNSTHYNLRMLAVYHSSGGYDIGSGVSYHDGTAWRYLGSNETATPGSVTQNAVSIQNLYDSDYSTAAYKVATFNFSEPTATEVNLYEQDLFWATGEQVEVLFTIRNEYGNPVENATVTATRQADNITLSQEVSDLSGKVRFDMGDDLYYTINVSANGYQNFSGTLHVLETSYSITITSQTYSGSVYETIFRNLTFITSPDDNPPAAITNFTINVNDSLNRLLEYGVYTRFNGSLYEVNGSAPGGSLLNLTMNLTNHSGKTISVYYWFNINGSGVYTQWRPFIIGGISYTNTSIQALTDDFFGGMSPIGRALLATFAIIIIIVMLSAIGLPGSWSAAAAVPMFIGASVLGYFDPVVGIMVAIILTGVVILSNRGGLS